MLTTMRDPSAPRCYVVLDLESAVIDDSAHRRYREMERWTPADAEAGKCRRGYEASKDPLITPRWPFQSVVALSAMVLVEHCDGNLELARFATFSAPDLDEAGAVAGLFDLLAQLPPGAELVTWAGASHDIPLIVLAALRNGISLPKGWGWLAFCGDGRGNHIDLCRVLTGGSKMKLVHMAEYLAALSIPAKLTTPPFAVASLIAVGDYETLQEVVEGDVISTALLLARWRSLLDPRARFDIVEERLLRQIEEQRPNRAYRAALHQHRERALRRWIEHEGKTLVSA